MEGKDMRLMQEIFLTCVGMGSTTTGIILTVEWHSALPMLLVLLGIPVLIWSTEVGDDLED